MTKLIHLMIVAVALACAPHATAQDQVPVRVDARVTGVVGPAVEIDVGTEHGVEPGDRVLLFPPGRGRIEGAIGTVTEQRAKLVLSNTDGLTPGTPCEVHVPAARAGPSEDDEHPPWERPVEDFDPEQPLLTPGYVRAAAERDMDFRGRLYAQYDWTRDDEGSSSEHELGRTGLDMAVRNPFGRGGELDFDVELWTRSFEGDDADDEDESRLRLDRFSYVYGGVRETPQRVQGGRFLQNEFPELGVLDGAEYTRRLDNGDRVGFSAGFMPELNEDFESGDDFQTSVYYTHTAGENQELEAGAAFQKTWHEGESDRDLLVGKLRFRPRRGLYFWSTARVDHYGSEDEAKSSGFELTDLNLGATVTSTAGDGVSLTASQIRFPELLRDEFTPVTAQELADNELNRVGVSGWKHVAKNVRLSARIDRWDDDDSSGTSGEIAGSVRDLLWDRGELSLALFDSGGEFSDTQGARITARGTTKKGFWSVQWEIADFAQSRFDGDQESLTQHRLRASWDMNVGRDWSVSVFGEERFGDEQDSRTLGLYLQRSF
ncbi:MAG: hypothetical protein GY711_00630 [bacterium]|nr:hypothetical protein [bacterium]